MKTRDAIKLIGDGQAQKLKKDKVIESWIKVDIGTMWQRENLVLSPQNNVPVKGLFFCFCFLVLFLFWFSLCELNLRHSYAYVISKTFYPLCTLRTLFALCTCEFFP